MPSLAGATGTCSQIRSPPANLLSIGRLRLERPPGPDQLASTGLAALLAPLTRTGLTRARFVWVVVGLVLAMATDAIGWAGAELGAAAGPDATVSTTPVAV